MCNCNGKGHTCIKTISVVTAGASNQIPDSADIRDGKIRSIMLRRLGGATGKDVNGANLAPDTVIATAHLLLVNAKNLQIMNPIPLQLLQRDYNSPEPFQVNQDVYSGIDLTRSKVVLSTAAAGYSATDVVELVFEYDCPNC